MSESEQHRRDRLNSELDAACRRALVTDAVNRLFYKSACMRCHHKIRKPVWRLEPMGIDQTHEDMEP